jgi:biopolymer transport protein TolR
MSFSTSSDSGDDVLSEINVTPLVDVMLVLLVAFIVTAPLMNNAIQVNLPKTTASKITDQQKPVNISVTKEGKVFINKDEVQISELESKLRASKQSNPDLAYHLSSDEAIQYGVVAKVMAAVDRAGITKLAMLTQAD